MTSIEREEKEKVKKKEKKQEEEETMQQATWVKYTFPVKHQVTGLRSAPCVPSLRVYAELAMPSFALPYHSLQLTRWCEHILSFCELGFS